MSHLFRTQTKYLSVSDIRELITSMSFPVAMSQLCDYITHDYKRWNDFDKCERMANHSPTGVIELMPISDAKTYTFKYVNGHPSNPLQGLSTVMAFGVLADVATGIPRLLSELTLTTAIRTAAMSVVAAKALARPDSHTMALIGNGAQSEFQALAFHYLMGINTLHVFDTDPEATQKLSDNLATTGLNIIHCASIADAVNGSDIVTTITADKTKATIITPDMLVPGMHINGVGGDCPGKTELHPDVLRQSSVFVQYEAQTRIEGDLQQMPLDFPVVELWHVLTGAHTGRQNRAEVTIFDSVGFALEDYSSLRWLLEVTRTRGLGQYLNLVPELENPKNLFSLIRKTTV